MYSIFPYVDTQLIIKRGNKSIYIKVQYLICRDFLRDANPDAEAEAWHWVKIRKGQGLFRRSADASPEAEAWHWVRLRKGQGLFRRSADASPEAEAWHWVRLRKGQGLF
ncbi:Mating factor alpha-1 [Nakaseomyces glabratus]|nr:Mating factor alpha-1 [Nakaseomyces glabratus]